MMKETKKKSRKGESCYNKSLQILNKLYAHDYSLDGITYNKFELYSIYMKYLRKAAYAGYPEAEFDLGQTYEDVNFWGVNKKYSPKKCFFWYTKACKNNVSEACNCLAYAYDNGIGCLQDKDMAKLLYQKAIALGSTNAKNNLRILLKQQTL